MKILGIVTVYYPEVELLRRSILSYGEGIEKLILWDNSPQASGDLVSRLNLPEYLSEKVEVMTNGENAFVAHPLNVAVEYGRKNGYTHLLTMDQDSLFRSGDFPRFIQKIEELPQTGVYVPHIITEGPYFDSLYAARHADGTPDSTPVKVNKAITSGSIFHIPDFEITGNFREDYAIYMVDYEYTLRAAMKGVDTWSIDDVHLIQQMGKTEKKCGVYVGNYSPLSWYYQIRNRVIFRREYKNCGTPVPSPVRYIAVSLIKVFLFERPKFKKLFSMLKGIRDGLRFNISK